MRIKNLHKLILSIGICEGAGIVGSFFTISAITGWYKFLNKPSFIVIYKFWKVNKLAGVLLLPYFIWVSFAAILNYNILILN